MHQKFAPVTLTVLEMFQVYRASGKKTYWRFKKKKEKRKREIEEKEKKKRNSSAL